MGYYFKHKCIQNPKPLFFLCGIKYNKKIPNEDKRVVLKKFLDNKGFYSLILEKDFPINKYRLIGLDNLNDVETSVCMIADGIFIIHESHSTAAEIALFASNNPVANKVFILVPDKVNAGVDHFSGFLSLAYGPLITEPPIIFYPVTETHIISESNIKTFTYFNDNKIGKNLGGKINECISHIIKKRDLNVIKANYGEHIFNSISYYFISDNVICISIDVQLLKYYIIAIFSISEFRNELRNSKSFYKALAICEKWFIKILLNTIERNERKPIKDYKPKFEILNSTNPRLELREAISLILYCFDAFGWIKIPTIFNKGIAISKETVASTGFKSVYSNYADVIGEDKVLNLGGIL